MVTVIVFLRLFFPPHFSLAVFSVNSLQLLPFVPFSSHSFQISLKAVLPSYSCSTFWALLSLPIFYLPFFHMSISTYSSPVYSENFPPLQPPLSVRPFFSPLPSFFLSSCFHKPAPLLLLFIVICTLLRCKRN